MLVPLKNITPSEDLAPDAESGSSEETLAAKEEPGDETPSS